MAYIFLYDLSIQSWLVKGQGRGSDDLMINSLITRISHEISLSLNVQYRHSKI